MPTITLQELKKLIASNHVVCPYPRKGYVSVDGFKKFKASSSAFAFLKSLRVA